jgi:DNA mismatch repair protein MutS2
MNSIRGKVNQSFGVRMSHYNGLGYLDDIKRKVQNRRVLAVLAMYRRKVKELF